MYSFADANNNPYRNMTMDAMKMNYDGVDKCLIVDEEQDVKVDKFFFF